MEFFAEIKNADLDTKRLQKLLSIKQLPELCRSIDSVITDDLDSGIIYCIWGEFEIKREELDHGIRFTLPHCPNAIAWTITYDEYTNEIVIHCTMNKKEHDADFIETIEQFVADWEI
ncbi:MAG: hypothetical protein BMS9Abin19_0783 [Gammaproteobacteria bacterium]|nr:MAG: hypothetical protein BMS9Abin19_0783 [Gammaproteobacteria bacterium]